MLTMYSSTSNNISWKQLQAWIWEAGVKLDFEDVSSRVEKIFSNQNDTLESYFNEGVSTTLLFAIRQIQIILKDMEIGKEEVHYKKPIEDILTLTVTLLRDERFYLDQQFISGLIVLHLTAVLFANVNLEFAYEDELLLKPPYDKSQWERAKKFLNFESNLYKDKLISCCEALSYLKKQFMSNCERTSFITNSCLHLRETLKEIFQNLVKQIPTPALCFICDKKNEEELKRRNDPQHKVIFKYIIKGQINHESLHHILNELEANPEVNSSSQSPPLLYIDSDNFTPKEDIKRPFDRSATALTKINSDKQDNSIAKDIKTPFERSSNGFININRDKQDDLKAKKCGCMNTDSRKRFVENHRQFDCRNRQRSKYDIVVLKGMLFEIVNEFSSENDDCLSRNAGEDNTIEVRNVLDIRKQTIDWDTTQTNSGNSFLTSSCDKVYEIRTCNQVNEPRDYGNNFSLVHLDKDINNLDKLIDKTKTLLGELERKSYALKEKREQIIKRNNNDNEEISIILSNNKEQGTCYVDKHIKDLTSQNSLKENERDLGRVKNIKNTSHIQDSNVSSCSTTVTNTFALNNNKKTSNNDNDTPSSTSSLPMPNLSFYGDNTDVINSSEGTSKQKKNSSSTNSSGTSMPSLTMYKDAESSEKSKIKEKSKKVKLEEKYLNWLDKGTPYVWLTPLSQSVLKNVKFPVPYGNGEVNSGNFLTKIDLIVTNSHSPEANAVILESDGSPHNSKKRKCEQDSSDDIIKAKKILKFEAPPFNNNLPKSSDSKSLDLSEFLIENVSFNTTKNTVINKENPSPIKLLRSKKQLNISFNSSTNVSDTVAGKPQDSPKLSPSIENKNKQSKIKNKISDKLPMDNFSKNSVKRDTKSNTKSSNVETSDGSSSGEKIVSQKNKKPRKKLKSRNNSSLKKPRKSVKMSSPDYSSDELFNNTLNQSKANVKSTASPPVAQSTPKNKKKNFISDESNSESSDLVTFLSDVSSKDSKSSSVTKNSATNESNPNVRNCQTRTKDTHDTLLPPSPSKRLATKVVSVKKKSFSSNGVSKLTSLIISSSSESSDTCNSPTEPNKNRTELDIKTTKKNLVISQQNLPKKKSKRRK